MVLGAGLEPDLFSYEGRTPMRVRCAFSDVIHGRFPTQSRTVCRRAHRL